MPSNLCTSLLKTCVRTVAYDTLGKVSETLFRNQGFKKFFSHCIQKSLEKLVSEKRFQGANTISMSRVRNESPETHLQLSLAFPDGSSCDSINCHNYLAFCIAINHNVSFCWSHRFFLLVLLAALASSLNFGEITAILIPRPPISNMPSKTTPFAVHYQKMHHH